MDWHWSPFMIPLGAFVVAIVAIVAGIMSEGSQAEAEGGAAHGDGRPGNEQPMTSTNCWAGSSEDARPAKDPLRSLGNARRTAIVLISVGVGLVFFGLLLTWIVQEHDVLVVAAAGLIPLAIGIGFVVDYQLQKRELSRFGLEIGPGEN